MSAGEALVEAVCCKSWPCTITAPIGRCGICKQVPVVVGPWRTDERQ